MKSRACTRALSAAASLMPAFLRAVESVTRKRTPLSSLSRCGRGESRRLAVITVVAGLSIAGSQTGCNGSSAGPTQPELPPAPPMLVPFSVLSQGYFFLLEPVDGHPYPRTAELLLDGRVIWSGEVSPVGPDDWGTLYNFDGRHEAPLGQGRHSFGLRVTDQPVSPTSYQITGGVSLSWTNNYGTEAITWNGVRMRLRTGQVWSCEFEVPETPSVTPWRCE